MLHHIARLVALLLRLLWPASGRRRLSVGAGELHAPVQASPAAPGRHLSPHEALIRGEDSPLVRPYLLAHEQRAQARQQRACRRTLWLAVHGIDVGPRHIHGVEVGSRRTRGNEVAAA
ncbi:hypothetical protein [Streptomyces sp. RK62]|uniref:hypothetical protein n=1 Tax=Streptomyces sp. RK62 TaxID=2824893 RepID=UPI0027E26BC2|nr:hypothetical protein [Streptomyces sp. RK62]